MDDASGEVLYENTGVSRYFMKNFSHDIMGYTKPSDFEESDWFEMDESKELLEDTVFIKDCCLHRACIKTMDQRRTLSI